MGSHDGGNMGRSRANTSVRGVTAGETGSDTADRSENNLKRELYNLELELFFS